jgi:hypothetical protein
MSSRYWVQSGAVCGLAFHTSWRDGFVTVRGGGSTERRPVGLSFLREADNTDDPSAIAVCLLYGTGDEGSGRHRNHRMMALEECWVGYLSWQLAGVLAPAMDEGVASLELAPLNDVNQQAIRTLDWMRRHPREAAPSELALQLLIRVDDDGAAAAADAPAGAAAAATAVALRALWARFDMLEVARPPCCRWPAAAAAGGGDGESSSQATLPHVASRLEVTGEDAIDWSLVLIDDDADDDEIPAAGVAERSSKRRRGEVEAPLPRGVNNPRTSRPTMGGQMQQQPPRTPQPMAPSASLPVSGVTACSSAEAAAVPGPPQQLPYDSGTSTAAAAAAAQWQQERLPHPRRHCTPHPPSLAATRAEPSPAVSPASTPALCRLLGLGLGPSPPPHQLPHAPRGVQLGATGHATGHGTGLATGHATGLGTGHGTGLGTGHGTGHHHRGGGGGGGGGGTTSSVSHGVSPPTTVAAAAPSAHCQQQVGPASQSGNQRRHPDIDLTAL